MPSLTVSGTDGSRLRVGRKRAAPPAGATFIPGDHVEVTHDEDGYIGAWYEAIVTRTALDGRYTVVYNGHMYNVETTHIRPRPPPFALNQAVDALDKDGWWVGVISAVDEEARRYTVLFAEEECEYRPEDLRPHMDWMVGEWILPDQCKSKSSVSQSQELHLIKHLINCEGKKRPAPASAAGTTFKAGERVEVTSYEEGYIGAWYEARVVRPTDNGCYTVVYDHLIDDVYPANHLIETVDATHIRPHPPSFVLHQFVDVFSNGGWWFGTISAVHEGSKWFTVSSAYEERVYRAEELRPHMNWICGEWVIPEKVQPEKIETYLPFLPAGLYYNNVE